ncbi:hypothetical protein [Corynebacterium sp. H130]|uniref:hypothetical protein n=1 Tax=Corynebacterium sp. H130 TaxID=3133444 RepID=UPI00309F0A96
MKFAKLAVAGILCCSLAACSSGTPEKAPEKEAEKAPENQSNNNAQATPGATLAPEQPKLGESFFEEVTFEFDSSAGKATLSYTDDKGVVDLVDQQMPYTVKAKTLKSAGIASTMPVDIYSVDPAATFTCRVLQGDRVIVEEKDSPTGASCMWSDANF